ncbi:unnamed protein product [Anisakis simplex]|uniref:WD_REPEATS_REGION domain-containing protein n=1 Tax=Anisakis simplex TaxID=6269 RepID=A0A0M3JDS8_ANISI|nr:unnamed protein product [Anisakis simplex]
MMQSVTSTNDSECTSTKLKSTISRLKGVDSPESSGSSVVRSSSPHKVTLNDAVRLSPASTRHKTSFAPSESGSAVYRTISTDSTKLNYAQSILDHSGRKSSNTSTTSTTSVSVPNRIINVSYAYYDHKHLFLVGGANPVG